MPGHATGFADPAPTGAHGRVVITSASGQGPSEQVAYVPRKNRLRSASDYRAILREFPVLGGPVSSRAVPGPSDMGQGLEKLKAEIALPVNLTGPGSKSRPSAIKAPRRKPHASRVPGRTPGGLFGRRFARAPLTAAKRQAGRRRWRWRGDWCDDSSRQIGNYR